MFDQQKLVNKAASADKYDDLFPDVARFVVMQEEASINKISKEFGIGFNRAQKIVELLSGMGVVSDNLGSKARIVLVDAEGLAKILE